MNGLSTPLSSYREAAASTAADGSHGVISVVFRHELRLAAGSFRLWAPALLLLVLMILAAVTSAARHRRDAAEQRAIEEAYARHLAGASIADTVEIRHPAVKPPWRLALVADGGQSATPDVDHQVLSALEEPELGRASREHPRRAGTAPLDWMLAIRVVLSIGAFLLCYGAVCGERQSGTLKLLFSTPIPRWKILTGKFLAAWVCLAVPFLASAAISLVLSISFGDLRPAEGDLARAALGVLLGLWAAAFFILVALLVSSLARDPSASLGVLALLWVAAVAVVPAIGVLLARNLQPLPTDEEINRRMVEARLQAEREVAGHGGRWRQPGWAAADGYAWEKVSARAENRRAALQEEIRREEIERKLRQASLARSLAALSPTSLMQNIVERLTGAGLERDRAFLEQAWTFRAALAERVRQLDAADPGSPHILYFRGYMSQRPLAPQALPRFVFQERTLADGLSSTSLSLLILSFETFLLVAATLFAFLRCDAG